MDEIKQTPATKPASSKGKKIISAIIVLAILAAGAATAYYLLNSKSKAADKPTTQSTTTTKADDPNAVLKAKFEETKKAIADAKNKPDDQRAILYAQGAFDGARIDAPEAKDYAAQALKLYPQDSVKNPPAEFKDYINSLTEISKGNYSVAKTSTVPAAQ